MTNAMHRLTAILLLCGVLCLSACGGQAARSGNEEAAEGGGEVEDLGRFSFSEWFSYEHVTVSAAAPQYDLPLDTEYVYAYGPIWSSLGLDPRAGERLSEAGFVVTDFTLKPDCDDVVRAYDMLKEAEAPVLVTSGSLLHVFHILFDNALRTVEAGALYDRLWRLSLSLHEISMERYRVSQGDLKEAARRDAIFFAIGLSLLEPEEGQIGKPARPTGPGAIEPAAEFTAGDLETYRFDVPAEIAGQVASELSLIANHAGFVGSPLFIYEEDYSQYVPRGHYTTSEKLKNYFKAMMWYGRMSMLLKGSEKVPRGTACRTCDALISEYDARIQTLGGLIISAAIAGDQELMHLWETIYKVTSFFVGFSDDLGPYEYIEAVNEVFRGGPALGEFTAERFAELKAKLAEYHSPRIYGGTGDPMIYPPFTPEQADEILDVTRGFRFMGQRFVPDSYVLSELVAPHTGEFTGTEIPFTGFAGPGIGIQRVFPRGLDVMAVLGSARARLILDELGDADYERYDEAFAEVKAEIDAIEGDEWNQNLYWNWIWMLKAFIAEWGPGYPTFMRGDAWQDRVLTQALASWSELRHDTILYVKQTYTMALAGIPHRDILPPEQPAGYVEPVLETYRRLLSLTRMLRQGLEAMELIDARQLGGMRKLENVVDRLIGVSTSELQGVPLSERDLRFIRDFGSTLDDLLSAVETESRKTTVVADVHTDTNSNQVLEEGCGYVDLLVIARKDPDGTIRLAAGPELSYYEFKQPLSGRLTDEAWREMLRTGEPGQPGWNR